MTHPYLVAAPHPRILAHRGLAAPEDDVWENTAAAVAAAQAAGADVVETDCRATADGDAVLIHDETLDRLFGDARRVGEVRTHELAELFAPHGGLLTLDDALADFPTVRFNIDVKEDAVVDPLARSIVDHVERVLVTSFSDARRRRTVDAALVAGAAMRPAVSPGQGTIARLRLMSTLRLPTRRLLDGIDALQIPERYGPIRVLTPSLLRAAHRSGVDVHVWTVNDPTDMLRLVDLGVDGIVTDRADVALATLRPR